MADSERFIWFTVLNESMQIL